MSEATILADSSGIDFLSTLPVGWNVKALGAICEPDGGVQTGPFGSQLHAADYVAEGIPSIMPVNIGDNRIVEEGIARIKSEDAKRLSKYLVARGDIVYSRRGDVERRALVTDKEDGWLCGTGCLRVRLKKSVNSVYASYYLGHPEVKAWIVRHAQGATMPNLNTSILSQLPFAVPPRNAQDAIAHFLASIDAKVDVLRNQNETLEAMARAIFKSWFVDFDPVRAKAEGRTPEGMDAATAALFPSTFTDSPLGPIPDGWAACKIADVAKFNQWTLGARDVLDTIRYIEISEVMRGNIGAVSEYKRGDEPSRARRRLRHGDTVMSTVRPDRGAYFLALNPELNLIASTGFAVATPKTVPWAWLYTALTDQTVFEKLGALADGGAYPAIRPDVLEALDVVMPDNPALLKVYQEVADPLLVQADQNRIISKTLSELRDTLLPRLISGKLRLTDAQALTEDAA